MHSHVELEGIKRQEEERQIVELSTHLKRIVWPARRRAHGNLACLQEEHVVTKCSWFWSGKVNILGFHLSSEPIFFLYINTQCRA